MTQSDPRRSGRARPRLAPSEKYELSVSVLTAQATQREAAERWKVDRSMVVHICRVAKQGALDALAAAVPGRPGQSAEQAALTAAREEVERLRATVAKQAVVIHLAEGKARWDQVPVPPQHRLGGEDPIQSASLGQQPGQRREHRPIHPGQTRPTHLSPKHGEFMAQHQDLGIGRPGTPGQHPQPGHELPRDQIQQSYCHDRRSCPTATVQRRRRSETRMICSAPTSLLTIPSRHAGRCRSGDFRTARRDLRETAQSAPPSSCTVAAATCSVLPRVAFDADHHAPRPSGSAPGRTILPRSESSWRPAALTSLP
jgi:hypothetical protein